MKVLIAVDESETAEKAFQSDGATFPSSEIMRIVQETNQRMKALQDKYDVRCDSAHMKHKSFFQTTENNAGEKIVTVADNEHCDVIVIGSRGLGRVRRTIMGSVSNYVIHHTKIPVLVYPKD